MNPNSQHQLWSAWRFEVREAGRNVPRKDVAYNFTRWARLGFGTVGRVRVRRRHWGWILDLVVEGKPVHDPAFVADVQLQFQKNFIEKGWGPLASGTVSGRLLAGDRQDGNPHAQLVELPGLELGCG